VFQFRDRSGHLNHYCGLLEFHIPGQDHIQRFVLDDVIAAGGQARAVRNNPKNSKLIADAIAVRKTYVDAVAAVRNSLSVPTEDPISRLAASEA
jgi:hypothetical protein